VLGEVGGGIGSAPGVVKDGQERLAMEDFLREL